MTGPHPTDKQLGYICKMLQIRGRRIGDYSLGRDEMDAFDEIARHYSRSISWAMAGANRRQVGAVIEALKREIG